MSTKFKNFISNQIKRFPHQPEFVQAVTEVAESVIPFTSENKKYDNMILERMIEPERMIIFRVPWLDDNNNIKINRGFRVEMNSAIGPYKGGLRFHKNVNLGILKFLAFEQVFKNSLTSLPLGGGKGGSDFDPKGKSESEIMRFCQSFMNELFRHIGPFTDIPAGDIGVGLREIGFMFGQYKKLSNEFSGVITGKGIGWGGSLIRPEATGYGNVYFAEEMLNTNGDGFKNKKIVISGSGNVAQYSCEKAIDLGAKVLTMSDSSGFIYDKQGINLEKLNFIKYLKNIKRGRISEYANEYKSDFFEHKKPWSVKGDIILPCATENELNFEDAKLIVKNGVLCVSEGANMPCNSEAIKYFQQKKILYAPGKASNAGGVAVSALEMSQNSIRFEWSRDEVDNKLKEIMKNIHDCCVLHGKNKSDIDYVKGANIGGFIRVADAMLAQGVV